MQGRTGIGVEKVVARHARLPRHACRDDHQVAALQALCQLILARVCTDAHRRVAMTEICRNASSASYIVEC